MSFSAQIVADSKNEFGNRITTFVVTFPRIILAEFNTHRVLSKNSASSRAIPYKKALKSVIENPFIPIGFMKDHSGMQGKEFLDMEKEYSYEEVRIALHNLLVQNFTNKDGSWDEDFVEIGSVLNSYVLPLLVHNNKLTIKGWWLAIRDLVVSASLILVAFGVTKQIANRLLEPFMWHTVIVTGTEWDNYFGLRVHEAAEIHMQRIAGMMLDEYNKSTPKLLKAGEWHIPFGDKMDRHELHDFGIMECDNCYEIESDLMVPISTVMAARTSYTVVGSDQKPLSIARMIQIHDDMRDAQPKHMSPFEHCAQVNEYLRDEWSGNFRGFVQYRKMIENETILEDPRVIKK